MTTSPIKVTGVKLSNGSQFNSKVLIDATEYGDIIPMTGADYRVGNPTNASINLNAPIQDITYTATIRQCEPGKDIITPDGVVLRCLKVPINLPPSPVGGGDTYTAAKARFMKYVQNDTLSQYSLSDNMAVP